MDDPSRLTEEQHAKFIEWLQQPGFDNTCPTCKSTSWSVGRHILTGEAIGTPGASHNPAYPMAFVICQRCYFIRHFSAVGVGLLPSTGVIDG